MESFTPQREELHNPASSIEHPASSIEHPASSIEHPGPSIEHPASSIQHRASSIEHPASSIQHPASNIQHPASSIEHPGPSIEHPASSIQHPASNIQHPASSIELRHELELPVLAGTKTRSGLEHGQPLERMAGRHLRLMTTASEFNIENPAVGSALGRIGKAAGQEPDVSSHLQTLRTRPVDNPAVTLEAQRMAVVGLDRSPDEEPRTSRAAFPAKRAGHRAVVGPRHARDNAFKINNLCQVVLRCCDTAHGCPPESIRLESYSTAPV
jgi:hypothetical protein